VPAPNPPGPGGFGDIDTEFVCALFGVACPDPGPGPVASGGGGGGGGGGGTQAAINAVNNILNGKSDCAKFFNDGAQAVSGESAADVFASDNIITDKNGPGTITQSEDGNTRAQPYAAKTSQGTGAGSDIHLNPNGAFFRQSAFVTDSTGRILSPVTTANLTIGGTANPSAYLGNTLSAQVTILLHELAHNLNLIPDDSTSPDQSKSNTQTIIDKCKDQINKPK